MKYKLRTLITRRFPRDRLLVFRLFLYVGCDGGSST